MISKIKTVFNIKITIVKINLIMIVVHGFNDLYNIYNIFTIFIYFKNFYFIFLFMKIKLLIILYQVILTFNAYLPAITAQYI